VVTRDGETDNEQIEQGGLASVGARLAAARNKKKLNVESVATDMHLRAEVVEALEAGDESKLPGTAFVRGYVKSYARLMGLDEVALLAQLPRIEENRPTTPKSVGMRRRGRGFPLGKVLVWGTVACVLAVLLVYGVPALERLWSSRSGQGVAPDGLPLPDADLNVPDQPGLLPFETESQPDEEVVQIEVEAETEVEVGAPDVDQQAGVEPEAAEQQTVEQPAAEQEPAAEPQPASETAGPAVVRMRFLEDSWLEMETNDRKLVAGTQRAGSERTVRAEPPIHVLLGNAPGVELTYRGEPVDLTPHQRGKVARFTLED
jgi:cytoskeleton protein RodZ